MVYVHVGMCIHIGDVIAGGIRTTDSWQETGFQLSRLHYTTTPV